MDSNIKNILITRSKEQSQEEFAVIESLGINVIYFPTIRIEESERSIDLKMLLSNNARFDYVIFPSYNSAKYFLIALNETFYDINLIKHKIAVGSKTKAYCEKHKLQIDLIPEKFSAEGVANLLSKSELGGKKVLIPKSEIGRNQLEKFLLSKGAEVFSIPVYKNEVPNQSELDELILEVSKTEIDTFLFTSPSSYENFVTIMNIEDEKEYFENKLIIPIGSTTKEAIEMNGVKVNSIPAEFTINGMIEELKRLSLKVSK